MAILDPNGPLAQAFSTVPSGFWRCSVQLDAPSEFQVIVKELPAALEVTVCDSVAEAVAVRYQLAREVSDVPSVSGIRWSG